MNLHKTLRNTHNFFLSQNKEAKALYCKLTGYTTNNNSRFDNIFKGKIPLYPFEVLFFSRFYNLDVITLITESLDNAETDVLKDIKFLNGVEIPKIDFGHEN
jgi:hypothetical protein